METFKLDDGREISIGTVIRATLRSQDLIPAFMSTLRAVNPAAYMQITVAPFALPPAYAQEDEDSEWWQSEECSFLLNETLFDAINEAMPEGVYFGAHLGDGSDFGFWEEANG